MKRIWFGAALLGALLVLGIFSAALMEDTHLTQASQLERAADLAAAGNWQGAESAFSEAKTIWEKRSAIISGLSDHEPMDQIEGCFAQLEVFGRMQEETAFAAACAETAKKVAAMAEAHRLMWNTFF